MDSKLSPALAKRLAAYSATAGVALACAPTAEAQIVYHDFEPDIVLDVNDIARDSYFLDVNDDRLFDFEIELYAYNLGPSRGQFRSLDIQGESVIGYYFYSFYVGTRLSAGDEIGPKPGPGLLFNDGAVLAYYNPSYGPEYPFTGEVGYLGFRFVAGGTHYGWLRLGATNVVDQAVLYGYAYQATRDIPILAGAVSAALLDGDVNQTVFPSSGGTLVYTFTVENTTDDPLPLDLWLDADGPAAFTRRLGSGTLPPGAAVTRTVSVGVPAGAAAGDYDLRFRLGHFGSGRFITFERYAITKEAGAGVAGSEAFAVTPFAGDLFAEADAAEVLVGTHALSEASPNPSDGRVALTLEVAEAQTVLVAVHDALGREVVRLHDGPLAAGVAHRLVFDGSGLPAGVYAVRAVGEAFADTRVLTLTR